MAAVIIKLYGRQSCIGVQTAVNFEMIDMTLLADSIGWYEAVK